MFSPVKQQRMTERVHFFNYLGKKKAAEDDHQNLCTIYFSTQNSKALLYSKHLNNLSNPVWVTALRQLQF